MMIIVNNGEREKTFVVDGDLDQNSMQEFSEIIRRELDLGEDKDFVIDLDNTRFIDSGCLGVISQANRELTAAGKRLRLTNVHGSVGSTLYVTSLDKILDISRKKKA